MKFTGSEFQYISLRDANHDIFIIVTFAKFCNHLELFYRAKRKKEKRKKSVAYAHLLYNKLTQYKHFKDLPPIPWHLDQVQPKCKNLEKQTGNKRTINFLNTIPCTFTRTLIVNNPKTAPEAPTETVFLGKISQETRFAPTPVRM